MFDGFEVFGFVGPLADSAAVLTTPWVQTEIPFWKVSHIRFRDDGSRHDSDLVVKKLDLVRMF